MRKVFLLMALCLVGTLVFAPAALAQSARACLTAHEGSHIINEAMTTIAR